MHHLVNITKVLTAAYTNFENEQDSLPDGLLHYFKDYFETIKRISNERLETENFCLKLEESINEVTMAIELPSE